MKIIRKAGDTSNILQIFIQDSSSTTGAGLTGLVFNSGSLTAYYHKDTDTTATAISLVTMTVGTFTSSGFKEIDSTNMPGWYQLCPPDAAFSTSGSPKSFGIHLKGATNMAPLAIEVQLVSFDLQLAALTAAQIATGVWQDTTAGDFTVSASIGKSVMNGVSLGTGLTVNDITTKTGYSLSSTQTFNVTGNITGNLSGSVGSVTSGVTVTTNNDKTGYALTSGERNSVADAILDRDMSTGADSGSTTVRTVRQALRFLRNKWAIAAGMLTVYKEDDSTSSWTSTVSTDAAAVPIIGTDPAGP